MTPTRIELLYLLATLSFLPAFLRAVIARRTNRLLLHLGVPAMVAVVALLAWYIYTLAAKMPEAQTQYWSLVSCEAMPSGQIVDGLTDMQVPLDGERNYTIVYSRKEDRPANATAENGVAWIEWSPRGEGVDGAKNRRDFGMLRRLIDAINECPEV